MNHDTRRDNLNLNVGPVSIEPGKEMYMLHNQTKTCFMRSVEITFQLYVPNLSNLACFSLVKQELFYRPPLNSIQFILDWLKYVINGPYCVDIFTILELIDMYPCLSPLQTGRSKLFWSLHIGGLPYALVSLILVTKCQISGINSDLVYNI